MQKQKGVSLLEIVIVIVIVGIIVAGSSNLLSVALKSFVSEKNIMDENWQTSVAMETMLRDLRVIRSPSDITSANNISITFNTTNVSSITYNITGSTLSRTEQGTSQILADNQQNLHLEFYANNGAAANTADTSSIRYITVNSGSQLPAVTTVYPWNLP